MSLPLIYADHNASSPLLPSIKEYLRNRFDSLPQGNPNAIHLIGQQLLQALETSRQSVAQNLGSFPEQIVFNSGATEGISTAFFSALNSLDPNNHIIFTSKLEHSSVKNQILFWESKGFEVLYINVTKEGVLDLKDLEISISSSQKKIALAAFMAINNETGVIQPTESIAQILKNHCIPFLCDTCQLVGKMNFDFNSSNVDYAVFSGHKFGSLPGIGGLLVKSPTQLTPLIFGAGQEKGLRGGTQNYIGIETLAMALDIQTNQKNNLYDQTKQFRDLFEKSLKEKFPSIYIAGLDADRLANTTMISLKGIHGQAVQIELESKNIFVTTSSACGDNEPQSSDVLKAMGLDEATGRGMIRISTSFDTAENDYPIIEKALTNIYKRLDKIKSY